MCQLLQVQTLMILQISGDAGKKHDEVLNKESRASNELDSAFKNLNTEYPDDLKMPGLETITTYDDSEEEADFTNLESSIHGKKAIGIKWVFKNKKDKRVIMIKNKAKLVAQGHTREEGIDYDKVFAHVARIKAIRIFIAYASFMGFMVYQMDVKSAFLYERLEEEVYVCQPLGFEDPDHPDKVYKVVKALYGLHQALRAWYETLANYLLGNRFHKGKIDHTLFIKRKTGDILLVQVYVDDIIFSSTKKELCIEFERLMKDKFQMSSMVELTFFLGLQVKQKEDGIFIIQDKYVTEVLRKFNFSNLKSANTSVDTKKTLVKDANGADYPKDSSFELVTYTDSDYVGVSLDRKSTTGGCQFLGSRLISWPCKKQTMVATSTTEAEYVAAASCYGQVLWIQNQMLNYGAKTTAWNEFSSTMASAIICLAANQKFKFSRYIFDHMVKNLEGGVKFLMFLRFVQVFIDSQVEGMLKHKEIYVTPSHTKKFFTNMKRQGKDFSGKVTPLFETMMVQPQEDMGKDSEIPTNSHHTPTVTQPSTSSQPQQKHKSKKSKKRITEVPQLSDSTHDVADEHETTTSNDPLLNGRNDQDMFDTSILDDEEVVAEKEVSTADPVPTADAVRGVNRVDPAKDKGKPIMIEPEIPLKRKDQIMNDEEVARNLEAQMQAELEEEERLARQKEEKANIALVES
nr:putative ribonuclease H-like domain-containing protein [Tanacetum cinerariifolium]